MPYLILVIGLIVGLFALYRFFINAQPEAIRTFFRVCIIIAYAAVMLFFAMTGRIFVSIGLALLGIPFVFSYYRIKKQRRLENSSNNHDDEEE